MATKKASKRAVTITERAENRQLEIIDRAAAAVGKSPSAFVLDAALRAAAKRPSVHRLVLSARGYRRFIAALDREPRANPKLRRLLATKAPWRD